MEKQLDKTDVSVVEIGAIQGTGMPQDHDRAMADGSREDEAQTLSSLHELVTE